MKWYEIPELTEACAALEAAQETHRRKFDCVTAARLELQKAEVAYDKAMRPARKKLEQAEEMQVVALSAWHKGERSFNRYRLRQDKVDLSWDLVAWLRCMGGATPGWTLDIRTWTLPLKGGQFRMKHQPNGQMSTADVLLLLSEADDLLVKAKFHLTQIEPVLAK